MGVAFLGLATIWLLLETDAIGNDDLRWFLPLPWLAAGLAGLLAVALTGRRSKPESRRSAGRRRARAAVDRARRGRRHEPDEAAENDASA